MKAWSLNQSTSPMSQGTVGISSRICSRHFRSFHEAGEQILPFGGRGLSLSSSPPCRLLYHPKRTLCLRESWYVLAEFAGSDRTTRIRVVTEHALSISGCVFTSSLCCPFAEMLRTQAVQEWAEICQANPVKSKVFGAWR